MLTDLVIDTNVLMHADNPQEPRYADAAQLVVAVAGANVRLAVDEGFHIDEAKNGSIIGHEYLEHLIPLSVGFQLVAQLVGSGRVAILPRRVPPATGRRINQLLRNRHDRTFLKVAVNSEEHVLCSHDYTDFSNAKRATIARNVSVLVCDAAHAQTLI